ncbi:MAG TPA: Crp/Fnr family transcriptional regulator [Dehalococcoidia bacterium]|nr:Crp/Fnr family transcriptional regulator [Dehalococcoidia bacterium]
MSTPFQRVRPVKTPRSESPPVATEATWGFLSAESLFGTLEPADRQTLEADIPGVTFGAGRLVHEAGQAGEILFWLRRGRLGIFRASGGRKVLSTAIEPGMLFGEMLIAGQSLSTLRIEALVESEAGLLRRGDLERLLHRHPVVAVRLLEILGGRLVRKRTDSAAGPAPSELSVRVAAALLGLVDRHTGDLVGATPQRLADAIGADLGEVTQTLEGFFQSRYLERVGTRARLRDQAALRRLAGP